MQTQIQDARSAYMVECAKIAGTRWADLDEAYSFDAAYDDGATPAEAVKDCIDWLDQ